MLKTREEIKEWLEKHSIRDYIINEDLTVDVSDIVKLHNLKLLEIPIQFGIVQGDFWCFENLLTSLKGVPKHVGGDFKCSYNKITSLEYGPVFVGKHYDCSLNKITSLQYAPEKVEYFSCNDNPLMSLQYCPRIIKHGLDFSFCQITDFNYLPEEVGEIIVYNPNIIIKHFEHLDYSKEIVLTLKTIKSVLLQKQLEQTIENKSEINRTYLNKI